MDNILYVFNFSKCIVEEERGDLLMDVPEQDVYLCVCLSVPEQGVYLCVCLSVPEQGVYLFLNRMSICVSVYLCS